MLTLLFLVLFLQSCHSLRIKSYSWHPLIIGHVEKSNQAQDGDMDMNLYLKEIYFSDCEEIHVESGIIEYTNSENEKCWDIIFTGDKYLILNFTSLVLIGNNCQHASITISASENILQICPRTSEHKTYYETFSSTEVNFSNRGANPWSYNYNKFSLKYTVVDLTCKDSDAFKCTEFSCIVPEKKCNGVLDCLNGLDETGCEYSFFDTIRNIRNVYSNQKLGLNWLKKQRNAAWGWRQNTHRGVIAMYLAQGGNFNGTNKDEDLTAKQLELRMSTAILRNSSDMITPTQLSMYIQALLVICHDPRNFYGYNLVDELKKQAMNSEPFHPLPYLALCNAKELIPMREVQMLLKVGNSLSNHSYRTDVQAIAMMALSCILSNGTYPGIKDDVMNVAKGLKKQQMADGSFGNIYTTALVIQALLSNNQEDFKDWNLTASINFLMQKQDKVDGSYGDFFATYLILPILSGKTLVDVGKINCSENRKLPRDGNPVSDIEMKLGKKISIHYTLFIGDKKQEQHPISLSTPENSTVMEVMRLAAKADPKYKFKHQKVMGKIYIYEIFGIVNDAEDGKFWLLYKGRNKDSIEIVNTSPDETVVHDNEDIVLWYKSKGILSESNGDPIIREETVDFVTSNFDI